MPQFCPASLRGCSHPRPDASMPGALGQPPAPYYAVCPSDQHPPTASLSTRRAVPVCPYVPLSIPLLQAVLLSWVPSVCPLLPVRVPTVSVCPSVQHIQALSIHLTCLVSVPLSCACSFPPCPLTMHSLSPSVPSTCSLPPSPSPPHHPHPLPTRVWPPGSVHPRRLPLPGSHSLPLLSLSSFSPPAPRRPPLPPTVPPTLTAALSLPSPRPKQPPPASKPSAPARAGPPAVPPSSSSATTSSTGCRSSSAPCWCGARYREGYPGVAEGAGRDPRGCGLRPVSPRSSSHLTPFGCRPPRGTSPAWWR